MAVTALSAGLARLKKVWQCLQAENGQAVDWPRPALLAKDILEHLLAVLWPCWEVRIGVVDFGGGGCCVSGQGPPSQHARDWQHASLQFLLG